MGLSLHMVHLNEQTHMIPTSKVIVQVTRAKYQESCLISPLAVLQRHQASETSCLLQVQISIPLKHHSYHVSDHLTLDLVLGRTCSHQ